MGRREIGMDGVEKEGNRGSDEKELFMKEEGKGGRMEDRGGGGWKMGGNGDRK